ENFRTLFHNQGRKRGQRNRPGANLSDYAVALRFGGLRSGCRLRHNLPPALARSGCKTRSQTGSGDDGLSGLRTIALLAATPASSLTGGYSQTPTSKPHSPSASGYIG